MAKDFKITKTRGLCHRCGEPLEPGQPYVGIVRTTEDELLREDYHPACWDEAPANAAQNDADVLGTWRSRVPQPQEKKKLLIDDAALLEFFHRLEDRDDPQRIAFRFVLALILMRKKHLSYEEESTDENGRSIWKLRLRGDARIFDVVDPKLEEEQIAEVSASLGDIMEGDFD